VNLTSHPDGVLIGPAVTSSEFIKTSADKVIAIEKGALFTRFIEENVHNKHKSLLIMWWTSTKTNPKLHTPTP
jgi:DNA topoisomerase-6 subunit A